MSQQPDTLQLQQRLYEQLTGEGSIPAKLRTSTDRQAEALKKAAAGNVVLVVLDGKLIYRSLRFVSINKLCVYRHVGLPAFEVI